MSAAGRLRRFVAARVAVDARALAAFRIGLGSLILLDLLLRLRHVRAFYTDFGVLPREALREEFPKFAAVSLHALSGGLALQLVLFALAAVLAICLLVGYRSRLAALLSLLFLVSLQARNPVVLNGGDILLRRLLIWSVLLPIGRAWSVDAARERAHNRTFGPIASIATAGLLVQVVAVYAVNAALKSRGDAWLAGTAVRYVFSLDQFLRPLGELLAGSPALLTAADYAWVALLLASPLLLLTAGRVRGALAALLSAGHLGMLATMTLGVFPLVTVVALLVFQPPGVWDRVPDPQPWFDRLARRLPELPRPSAPWALGRRGTRVLSILLLAFVLVWNAAAVGVVQPPESAPVQPSERSWDMFAPEPLGVDGWYVAPAVTTAGETVDAWNGGTVSYAKPPDVSKTYPSARWRKYLVTVAVFDGRSLADEFAASLCREWDATHGSELARVSVVFVAQPTRLDGPEPTENWTLATHSCGR
ncbi:HTTM domain-containing protein [Salarchaeum sp. JOR-1]|uniref:HTTM domain-containing protein n=1 Tax=Salarchaeum sp. JOR-1 TaxID=2599399 RepID=UPI0011987D01|nr:HTTM domain-containing protein [Salarchaeum sp. JOR-1]QDX41105.1 HTTM domain-containing protein [Salarchaeum sp. JOR-1]